MKNTNRSNMKKTKACRILQLPDHILVEIFCKISAKTLTQCRFVCKSWHSFFKDPQLIKDLFSGTLPSPSSSLLIYGSTDCNNITSEAYHEDHFYFLIDCDMASTSRRRRHSKALNPCPKDLEISFCVEIVGSCNGLLCLNEPGLQFYISNPMTSEFSLLPISKSYLKKYSLILGFGFSSISNVYKVLDIYRFQESAKVEAMVMTVGSGIWRSIDANPIMSISSNRQLCRSLYGLCLYMTYLNGFLHWAVPSNGSLLIYAFDLETEQFQQLPHFDFESGGAPCNLGVLRGCLSVLVPNSRDNVASVWMMKDYGVEASWTIDYEIHGLHQDRLYSTVSTNLLKVTEEEEVLVFDEKERELKVYGPGTTSSKTVKVGRSPVEIHGACDYIPNFLSLDTIFRGKDDVVDDESAC